jgi:hypothetical protein
MQMTSSGHNGRISFSSYEMSSCHNKVSYALQVYKIYKKSFIKNAKLGLRSGWDDSLWFGLNELTSYSGQHYKHATVLNDDSSIINKWSYKLIDYARIIIYDCNRFIGHRFIFTITNIVPVWGVGCGGQGWIWTLKLGIIGRFFYQCWSDFQILIP